MSECECVESELIAGNQRLICRVTRTQKPPLARLMIVHGYGEHCRRYVEFMTWMAERGIRCETFDFRGHGQSTGKRGHVQRWHEYLDDFQSFIDSISKSLNDEEKKVPLFVLGHSHGGLITAAAGERGILARAGVVGAILSSPYFAMAQPPPISKRLLAGVATFVLPSLRVPTGLRREWLSRDDAMIAEDRADALINHSATPRWFVTMRQAQRRVIQMAQTFMLPMLCVMGEADVVADPLVAKKFYQRAGSLDKSIYFYERGLHELLRDAERRRVFEDVYAWLKSRCCV